MVQCFLTFIGQLRMECYFLRLFPFRGLWKPWLSSGSSQDSLGRVLRALCELWDVPGEAWEHLQHSGAAQSSIYNYKLPINRTAAVMLFKFLYKATNSDACLVLGCLSSLRMLV